MVDIIGNEVRIGDIVAYAPNSSYAGIKIGRIEKFTPKQIGININEEYRGRHLSYREGKLYYTYSNNVIVINDLILSCLAE